MTRSISVLLLLLSAGLADTASAGLPVTVVHVRDGDTLTVLLEGQSLTLDLGDVDAPESPQAFAQRSRQSLVNLCEHREAILEQIEVDKSRRISAHIECAGVDAGGEQVRRGLARVIASDLPARSRLPDLEAEARAARRGIWAGEHVPVNTR